MKHKSELTKHHCTVVFAPYPLGETRVQREAEALIRKGFIVDVISLRTPGSSASDCYKEVNIYREKYRFLTSWVKKDGLAEQLIKYINFFFSATNRLIRLNKQHHYDSIQVHNLPDFLVFCALLPKIQKVPIILDLHDLMPELFACKFGKNKSMLLKLIRWQEKIACQFADHVITVSEHWRRTLIQRGVPENKCSLVMNVADENIFHISEEIRTSIKKGEGFRLIYHGAMVKRYGLDLAIKAVNKLRSTIPDIHLLLIGRGEYLPILKKMIVDLKLENYVTIEGLQLAEKLPELILACHVGIVPYRNDVFTDGLLPTKLFEYAALGMPAIAARTTAIQAYFSDANTEFFDPGDVEDLTRCISKLHENPERVVELSQANQNFNNRFNWKNTSESYVNLIEEMSS